MMAAVALVMFCDVMHPCLMMHHTAASAVCVCVCLLRAGDRTLPREAVCEMAEGGNEEKRQGKRDRQA